MALIAMALYSTEQNQKDECLAKTLQSLADTVDFSKHRFMVSINRWTDTTTNLVNKYQREGVINTIIYNPYNLGTAEAINKVWKDRRPNENCIKMDDDVVIHRKGWIELLEECLTKDPNIGIIGLKRKDCIETPQHPDPYFKSELRMLPHTPGHRWCIVEECAHVMGTCQLYNHALLDKIGYLYQPKQYGWDDVLACARSIGSGFTNVFYPHIEIDHIDPGQTPYQSWKEKHAFEDVQLVNQLITEYKTGVKSCYYNPFEL